MGSHSHQKPPLERRYFFFLLSLQSTQQDTEKKWTVWVLFFLVLKASESLKLRVNDAEWRKRKHDWSESEGEGTILFRAHFFYSLFLCSTDWIWASENRLAVTQLMLFYTSAEQFADSKGKQLRVFQEKQPSNVTVLYCTSCHLASPVYFNRVSVKQQAACRAWNHVWCCSFTAVLLNWCQLKNWLFDFLIRGASGWKNPTVKVRLAAFRAKCVRTKSNFKGLLCITLVMVRFEIGLFVLLLFFF